MTDARSKIANHVSRETLERLETYVSLLNRWNPRINLVAPSTLKDVWSRHILDSVQVAELANEDAKWADIGSGGGFPGLVVACLNPKRDLTLIESDQRKCLFMQTVIRECGLSARVLNARIEQVEPLSVRVLSARALAPLAMLLEFAERHLSADGTALFLKGSNRQMEITDARKDWTFDLLEVQSLTNKDSAILQIRNLNRV
ncbi:16S rRNA (guanine527-N7)-methyltransferase [Monaibacterium marinum]|uniref:Ribosomal RNA small subunit methyltransferase G n=1 Tax=Pontivivens marinum TaxID=1690039 RepID=A0A2C9CPW8_9RHOB|nr:16S rRNA (guanine(527)-N(7))-methyltransferase RsmG [Monaibacterium marinum]SOH93263.1 16S rRNA (guanine527-N7)-methyltransferase [Monaibacterium marinum]